MEGMSDEQRRTIEELRAEPKSTTGFGEAYVRLPCGVFARVRRDGLIRYYDARGWHRPEWQRVTA
jgi:hypothetical protein